MNVKISLLNNLKHEIEPFYSKPTFSRSSWMCDLTFITPKHIEIIIEIFDNLTQVLIYNNLYVSIEINSDDSMHRYTLRPK